MLIKETKTKIIITVTILENTKLIIKKPNNWDENRKSLIYCWTNKKNHKKYIGQTSQGVINRTFQHLCGAKYNHDTYFLRSILKYTPNNFYIEILDYCNTRRN